MNKILAISTAPIGKKHMWKKLFMLICLIACVICAGCSDEPHQNVEMSIDEVCINDITYFAHGNIDDEGNRIFHCLYYYDEGMTCMRLIAFEKLDSYFEDGLYIIHLVMPGKIGKMKAGSDLTDILYFDSMKYIPDMFSSYITQSLYVLKPHAGKITLMAVEKDKVVLHFDNLMFYSYLIGHKDKTEHLMDGTVSFYGPENSNILRPDEE